MVAVSGGVDSMVLLHLLRPLAAEQRWQLQVAHFNHQLRGRSSDADERLVKTTARLLGLPVVVGRGAVRRIAQQRGVSLEMAARELRHGFFARRAKASKATVIALAHHADDQVELFFLRLLRGSGGEGLAGMKWRSPSPVDPRVSLVRPLLDLPRAQLEQFARENKIPFRGDASNAGRDILRNRIRHDLLPLLRGQYQPAINQTVRRLMEIVGAESEVVTKGAQSWLKQKRRLQFESLPVAVQRRVLQMQLQQQHIAADYQLIESLRATAGRPVSVSVDRAVLRDEAGLVVMSERGAIRFNTRHRPVLLGGRSGQVAFDGVRIEWRYGTVKKSPCSGRVLQTECFTAARIGKQIVLRHWQPGDRYQPIGMKSAVKLQDWFTNHKIPRARRHQLLLATTRTGEIFWVEGQRIGERFKLTPKTRQGLFWRWCRA